MKVAYWSDLHLDFGYSVLESLALPRADVIVIAGDLAVKREYQRDALIYLSERFKHVIYVPGNHEYEGKDIDVYRSVLKRWAIPNVHILDDGFVDIGGVRFIGSTLWTDCGNEKQMDLLDDRIFKHWHIQQNDEMFGARASTRLHHKMVDYITFQLSEARRHNLEAVVVTHQAPSFNSVSPLYLASACNAAFYTDLNDLIDLHEPRFWFHGHMHHSVSYERGRTSVRCNPLGHPSSEYRNVKFDANAVVQIDPLEEIEFQY